MSPIFDWFFGQYQDVPSYLVVLEIVAVIFGLFSVWFSKRDNILVFPTGIISTLIFVYILLVYELLGDMLINAYYFLMSIYGWILWSRKDKGDFYLPITQIQTNAEIKKIVLIFVCTLAFVVSVYFVFDKWDSWTAYVDTITTGIFFIGMWLMAKKKVENWTFWIIGDIISVPLYLYKGLIFSAFQYVIFTIIAYYGLKAWQKHINEPNTTLLK